MIARILVIDDEKEMCWAIGKNLGRKGYEVEEVYSGEEAIELVEKENFNLAIMDYKMPGINGIETLEKIKKINPDIRVIFMTAYGDDELAMKSLEKGADDFLHKPFDMKNLVFRVHKTLKFHNLTAEVQVLRGRTRSGLDMFVADCAAMKEVLRQIGKVSKVDAPVMIYGETGTGKEIVAGSIHYNELNPRKDMPFITINSAAIPEPLMESELFGHSKGAFTGAGCMRHGLFEAADGGTLFLDEISSAPLQLQVKLLRILDSGEFMRVGESRSRKVDVRIITATNKNLASEVEAGTFREDLYHRLNVLKISLPSLKDRGEDIDSLVDYFMSYYSKKKGSEVVLDSDTRAILRSYSWPGNVRELKHCIERLVLMSDGNTIFPSDLPERLNSQGMENEFPASFTELKAGIINDFEKKYFSKLLKDAMGNVSKASRNANMNRAYLIKKIKEHDIQISKES